MTKCEHLDKIKIVATDQNEFNDIEVALKSIDPLSIFLKDFEYAVRYNCDLGVDLGIELEYSGKLERNLNKRKYEILLPETFAIEELEILPYADEKAPRVPRYKLILICRAEGTDAIFKIIYPEMTDPIFAVKKERL